MKRVNRMHSFVLSSCLLSIPACTYTTEFGAERKINEQVKQTKIDELVESGDYKTDRPEDHGFKKKGLRWTPPEDTDTSVRDVVPYSTTPINRDN